MECVGYGLVFTWTCSGHFETDPVHLIPRNYWTRVWYSQPSYVQLELLNWHLTRLTCHYSPAVVNLTLVRWHHLPITIQLEYLNWHLTWLIENSQLVLLTDICQLILDSIKLASDTFTLTLPNWHYQTETAQLALSIDTDFLVLRKLNPFLYHGISQVHLTYCSFYSYNLTLLDLHCLSDNINASLLIIFH